MNYQKPIARNRIVDSFIAGSMLAESEKTDQVPNGWAGIPLPHLKLAPKRAFWRRRGITQYFEVEILRRSSKRVLVAGVFGRRWVKPRSLEPGVWYRFNEEHFTRR